MEVLKFHPEDSELFYNDLVWTFQNVRNSCHFVELESLNCIVHSLECTDS